MNGRRPGVAAQSNLLFEQVKYAEAREMRACARVKWRFRRSAVSVSLRDGLKFWGFCRFVLPYPVPGCRTFGLKIAASLRSSQ